MTRRIAVLLLSAFVGGCTAGSPETSTQPPVATVANASAGASPTASRPTGRIALVRFDGQASDVFVVDPDGSNAVRVTSDGASEHGLIWSPDGARLFYESQTPVICGDSYCDVTQLLSARADGSDSRVLGAIGERPQGRAWRGALSPDGRLVAYGDEHGSDPILIVDLSTGGTRRLETVAGELIWSPDGTRLLTYALDASITVLDASSGRTVFHLRDPWTKGIVGWTDGGRSVIYQRCDPALDKPGAMACLAGSPWVVRTDTGSATPAQSTQRLPVGEWVSSPDATRFATMLDSGLYVGTERGSGNRIAAMPSGWPADLPSWSPDGQWIAFGVASQDGRSVYVVARDGGEPIRISDGSGPAWQPAGS